jgi:nitrate reductase molybdenum cofactor assembly chaperone NarJ/NarW
VSVDTISTELRAFAELLEYPTDQVGARAREAADLLGVESPEAAALLTRFAETVDRTPLVGLEELYTRTFDFDDRTQPYLGGHLFGETYKRSILLVGLSECYGRHGFERGGEMADHVSVVLRFLAHAWGSDDADEVARDGLLPALRKIVEGLGTPDESAADQRGRDVYGLALRALSLWLDGLVPAEAEPAGAESRG